ncbi:MAG TPA: diffusible signal factor-reguated Ax21 family protein [Arenimonas sp.]|tara:strand:+ start:2155 stop:2703 length:549 start_codon:yes stop_codon:yes gene_type:complete
MKRSLIALAFAALLPLSAQADDKLSYTWVEADYLNVDGDADGFGLRGSLEFGDSNFYGFGGFNTVEIDNSNIDVDSFDIGLGYAHSLSDNVDLLSEISYLNSDVSGFGDLDGYRASVGVRGSFSPNFEGMIKANYTDGDNFDGDFTATVGAQYKFTQTWGVVGEIEAGDGGETYLVGLRASF